jgi:TolB-like protein
MDDDAAVPAYRFEGYALHPSRGLLLAPDGTKITLRPKAFTLLRYMLDHPGRLIDRDEIMRAIWPGVFVTEDSLTQCVKEVRRALGDAEQGLLRTLPRRGYMWATAVFRSGSAAPASSGSLAPPPAGDASEARAPTSGAVVVVLPFANMTGDPGQEYFADGITEDLTNALSHLRWFSVISRNSAFTYKGRAVDVRRVGSELGVNYVLEGSLRNAGGQLRISVQLCEAESGRHVWAERFDGELAEIFSLQDRVTEAVAGAIEPSLRLAERERARSWPTESLTAYDLYLRALPWRNATRERNDEGLRLLRRAIALDPGFVAARGLVAGLHCIRFAQGWAEERDLAEGVRCAREVVGGDGDDPTALAWAAHALAYLAQDYDAGLAAADRALALAPNAAHVLLANGLIRSYVADADTAIPSLERAMRLSPMDPAMPYITSGLSLACFVTSNRFGGR